MTDNASGPTVSLPATPVTEIPAGRIRMGRLVAFALIPVTFGLALAVHLCEQTSLLESIGFVTGVICVWLTVKENIWNFPVSLLNVAALCVVYFGSRLFADASLQIVYFVLTAIGWYLWLHGGADRNRLRVARASGAEIAIVGVFGVLLTIGLWVVLRHFGGSASFFDALTTAISLCAQWLLNRKRIENWLFWMAADVIYVPLYAYKSLFLTAILYGIFLVMCVIGWQQWKETMARERGV
jgi:nicotinamide mononucleotide transporter